MPQKRKLISKINNTLDGLKICLEEINSHYPTVHPSPVLVGTGKRYLSEESSLEPRDLDVLIVLNRELPAPGSEVKAISDEQSKIKRSLLFFNKIAEHPVQFHFTVIPLIESGWIQSRMTPPADCRGYVLGSFFQALSSMLEVHIGYWGVLKKTGREHTRITINPNFTRDLIKFLTGRDCDISWKSDSLENIVSSSKLIFDECKKSPQEFQERVLKILKQYQQNDDLSFDNQIESRIANLFRIEENQQ